MKRANPRADVTLPDGYYDTDEEEEIRYRALIRRKMTSKFVVFKVDENSGLVDEDRPQPFGINKSRTTSIKKQYVSNKLSNFAA